MSSGVQQLAEESSESGLKRTEIHDVLRNDRRRLVLSRLREAEMPVSVRDLSEYVAGVEAGETPAPRNVRQSVYVSLHQTHIPKLEELGIIEQSDDGMRLSQHADEVTVYLEVVPKHGLSWGEYYLGVAVLGLLVQTAGFVGVPFVRGLDAVALATAFFGLFALSAIYHISTQQSTLFDRLRS
ncbi:hypothetical protein SAMN04487948_104380 [Halogranum amylolyticum]|uniref:DUF7344 domain-containing protein n=1 Tax=Halogranum amylolyticum TaxID=660520 RepID=A0A1H8S1L9_9EURY|nr:hypothetical protein [Halogranum amylolyticum]SEO72535.1 hypothetical protein SAMN04487948_104380 [Halogranum amylolyticum]